MAGAIVQDWVKTWEQGFKNANEVLAAEGYSVSLAEPLKGEKDPIFLALEDEKGDTHAIGIVHVVQLSGKEWDTKKYAEIARTVDEVAESILTRVKLYNQCKADDSYHIMGRGSIFDFGSCDVNVEANGTFSVDSQKVTHLGEELLLSRLASEGIIKFVKDEATSHIELVDTVDTREGKGIFINEKGEIYRG